MNPNKQRAQRAHSAITARYDDADMQDNITDLLTDLRHLCLESGYDFFAAFRSSANHFGVEASGQGSGARSNEMYRPQVVLLEEGGNIHEVLSTCGLDLVVAHDLSREPESQDEDCWEAPNGKVYDFREPFITVRDGVDAKNPKNNFTS